MTLDAVVFDFDGLIIDSEWAIFETARGGVRACTATSSTVEAWATIVGLGDDDDELAWSIAHRRRWASRASTTRSFSATYARAAPARTATRCRCCPGVEVLVDSLVRRGRPDRRGVVVVARVARPSPRAAGHPRRASAR